MKNVLLAIMMLTALFAYSCATDEGYNTQKGAAIGAVGGALMGQVIGRNTAGTLIGAAGGALVGAVAGNAMDQDRMERKAAAQQAQPAYVQQVQTQPVYVPPPPAEEAPPGQWVEVPGTWVDGRWVPAHRTWVPLNPNGQPDVVASAPPPPPYQMAAPPDVIPIPGTYVYFVPGIEADVLFYHGYWYRPFRGRWFRASGYNGPWFYVAGPRVPRALVMLPPGWHRVPPGYAPISHARLHANWERWERERRFDHPHSHP